MGTNPSLTTTQSTLIILSESEAQVDEKRLLLMVHCDEKEAGRYYYWIGESVRLGELLVDYARRVGISINYMRFLYNGSDFSPFRSLPVGLVGMKDGDSIDVVRKEEYECRVKKGHESTLISLPRAEGERPICLHLECVGTGGNLYYLIGRNTPLEDAFRDYADRTFRFYEGTEFSNTRIGSRVDPRKTADELKLEDGDIIRAETSSEAPPCVIL